MKPVLFFAHSAGSQTPPEGSSLLLKWLHTQFGERYDIRHPAMPNPENPEYRSWATTLTQEFIGLQGKAVLVGHSLGGSVLLKYLSENRTNFNIETLILCAVPFWSFDEDWPDNPFVLADDFAAHLPPIKQLHIIHSRDDPEVSAAHAERYKRAMPQAALHIVPGDSHLFERGIAPVLKLI